MLRDTDKPGLVDQSGARMGSSRARTDTMSSGYWDNKGAKRPSKTGAISKNAVQTDEDTQSLMSYLLCFQS